MSGSSFGLYEKRSLELWWGWICITVPTLAVVNVQVLALYLMPPFQLARLFSVQVLAARLLLWSQVIAVVQHVALALGKHLSLKPNGGRVE